MSEEARAKHDYDKCMETQCMTKFPVGPKTFPKGWPFVMDAGKRALPSPAAANVQSSRD